MSKHSCELVWYHKYLAGINTYLRWWSLMWWGGSDCVSSNCGPNWRAARSTSRHLEVSCIFTWIETIGYVVQIKQLAVIRINTGTQIQHDPHDTAMIHIKPVTEAILQEKLMGVDFYFVVSLVKKFVAQRTAVNSLIHSTAITLFLNCTLHLYHISLFKCPQYKDTVCLMENFSFYLDRLKITLYLRFNHFNS